MTKKEEKFICCICKGEATGYGNNPAPLCADKLANFKDARCCNLCDIEIVIPTRIRIIQVKKWREQSKTLLSDRAKKGLR